MKVLVSAASKHGATIEIADAIGATLRDRGLDAEVRPPEEVAAIGPYGAVVLGSAIYAGRWLEPAKELVERELDQLRQRNVWLFSSGPVGDPPKPEDDPIDGDTMLGMTGAREHRLFAGRIDRQRLSLGERLIVTAVRAADGDYRPWDDIRAWAREIAVQLDSVHAAGPTARVSGPASGASG